jgi:peptidoglycan biosynthesis protein MviN/MurJ (putative lipid II flippase)
MNQDVARIRKIALISIAFTAVLEVACYFVLRDNLQGFLGILVSGLLTLLLFMATLLVYLKAAKAQPQNKLKYLMIIFFAKMAVSAAVFYIVFRFQFADMRYLLISFLILFTLFLNLEIFLIYKRVLFYKK